MRVLGIDPGSIRTGYGCVEGDGSRHRLVASGAVTPARGESLADRLLTIHREIVQVVDRCCPDSVAIESVFSAANARSALRLGHVRGVTMLAAVEARLPVAEYSPTQVKRAVVGYGRAEKQQVQQMVKFLLGLAAVPRPHDAADALAVAICHLHHHGSYADPVHGPARTALGARTPGGERRSARGTSWRRVKL